MYRQPKILIFFAFLILCSGILQAADCCSPANQKIHKAMQYAAAHNLSSFEVNLGSVNPKLRPARPNRAKTTDPLVFVYQNGFNRLGKDLDPDDECWDLFWTYVVGAYVYYGLVAANYETTDEAVQLNFTVEGSNNFNRTIKRSRTIPSQSVVAYFVRLKLAQSAATYLLTTKVYWRAVLPFVLLDQVQTYSYVSDVQL